jgi:hypothetical protein
MLETRPFFLFCLRRNPIGRLIILLSMLVLLDLAWCSSCILGCKQFESQLIELLPSTQKKNLLRVCGDHVILTQVCPSNWSNYIQYYERTVCFRPGTVGVVKALNFSLLYFKSRALILYNFDLKIYKY